MPEKDPSNWPLATWLLALGMALLGGLVNSLGKLKKARRFKLVELCVELLASGFVGLGVFMLLAALEQPEGVCAAASGVAAHMGTRLLFLVERLLKMRLSGEGKS